jgi:type I restriction enzyme S subunit
LPGMREVPYLRVANVQRGFLDLSEMKTIKASPGDIQELALRRGDVLFTEGGDRDKLGRGWVWSEELPECIHQNHIFRARLSSSGIQPSLVSHHGNTFGRQWFTKAGKQTTNLASINLGILKRFPVPLPPPAEQEQIVALVEERLSQIDSAEKTIDAELIRAKRLRQSILKRAFEGKLVPQDPQDEPARVLLERIKASREAEQPKKKAKKSKAK